MRLIGKKTMIPVLIIVMFFGFGFTHTIYADETGSEEDRSILIFDPEDVESQKGNYSALTDLYGISIFSKEFDKLVEEYDINKEVEQKDLFELIMTQEQKKESYDLIFTSIIRGDSNKIKKQHINQNESTNKGAVLPIMFVLLGMMVCFILLMELRKRSNKRREKHEDYFDNYHFEV